MPDLITPLRSAIASGDAVIRLYAEFEPASGGAKVLPPTYAGGKHNMTVPREDGSSAWCSLDSPASFANRAEAALYDRFEELAPLRVQIGEQTLSTLQLPHRAFDATLRESRYEGTPWLQTSIARAMAAAQPQQAYQLLHYDPALLLFGGWDSTKLGARGQAVRDAKYCAALSCEITASDVVPVARAGNRIDPLGIEGTEASLVEHEDGTLEPYAEEQHGPDLPVRPDRDNQVYPRRVKPSQANLGNIIPSTPDGTGLVSKGVLVRGEITLHGVIDLRRLTRYRFAPADDDEVRLLLALMGLYGVYAVLRQGLDLRRDCELLTTRLDVKQEGFLAEPVILDLSGVEHALEAQIATMRPHIAEPIVLTANDALKSLLGMS